MTVRWVTTPKDRLTRKFKALHKQLAGEIAKQPEPDKADRKRIRNADYRQCGGI